MCLDLTPSIVNCVSQTILLAVTGMSPAVLTETVWAFGASSGQKRRMHYSRSRCCDHDERWLRLPLPGQNCSARIAFGNPYAKRSSALDTIPIPSLCFGVTGDCVKVFTRRTGGNPVELKDISNEAESAAVADFITDELWGHVAKPDTRVIASISGGFKTMSALLFVGMSLLGRNEDLTTHVLVNQPFDEILA